MAHAFACGPPAAPAAAQELAVGDFDFNLDSGAVLMKGIAEYWKGIRPAPAK